MCRCGTLRYVQKAAQILLYLLDSIIQFLTSIRTSRKSIYNDFDFHVIRFSSNAEVNGRASFHTNYENTNCGAKYFVKGDLNNWQNAVLGWCFVGGSQSNDQQIILRKNENNVVKAVQTTLDVNSEKQFRYVCAVDHGHGDWYPDSKGNTYMKWQDFGGWFNMYASVYKANNFKKTWI